MKEDKQIGFKGEELSVGFILDTIRTLPEDKQAELAIKIGEGGAFEYEIAILKKLLKLFMKYYTFEDQDKFTKIAMLNLLKVMKEEDF